MKKYLSLLGLLVVFAQPSFAQCGTCNPCAPACPVAPIVAPLPTGAACPVAAPSASVIVKPMMTGAACPVQSLMPDCEYCNPCNQRRGFWRNFFSF